MERFPLERHRVGWRHLGRQPLVRLGLVRIEVERQPLVRSGLG